MKIIFIKEDISYYPKFKSVPDHLYSAIEMLHHKEDINIDFIFSFYTAIQNDKPVGRFALYKNPHIQYLGKVTFIIGNYESVNDLNISKAIIEMAKKESKSAGAEILIGPMNGSTWNNYRFCETEEALFFTEPVSKNYYYRQFLHSGFDKIADYISNLEKNPATGIQNKKTDLKSEGFKIRKIDPENFEKDLYKIYKLSLEVFKKNYLFSPISSDAFLEKYIPLKRMMDPDFILLAEQDSQLKGFIFGIQDFYCKDKKRLIIKTVARSIDSEFSGLGKALINEVMISATGKNYEEVIHAFMLKSNHSTLISEELNGQHFKTYGLYGCELQ